MKFWDGGKPHAGQWPIWRLRKSIAAGSGPRVCFMPCGPRWGKDRLSTWLCLYVGLSLAQRRQDSPLIPKVHQWVVAPTYKLTEQLWREYETYTRPIPGVKIEKQAMRLTLPGDYVIEFRSTTDPAVLAGVGLDIVHVTEAADIAEDAWTVYLSRRLISPGRLGFACINGTPNIGPPPWFVDFWRRGEDPTDDDVVMVNQPTWENPTLSDAALAEILAERDRCGNSEAFRATVGAELILEAGGALRRVAERHVASPEVGNPRHRYVGFYDPAKTTDYNGVAVFKLTGKRIVQVYADRWNGTEWAISRTRLAPLASYPGHLYIDTGFDPYGRDRSNPFVASVQSVVGSLLRCRGHRFDNANKERMTENMALLLENARVDLLDPAKCTDRATKDAVQAQIRELGEWRAKRLDTGRVQYAGGGAHDDMAVAVMAACQMASEDSGDWKPVMERLRVWG